jgi:hypothetical protein
MKTEVKTVPTDSSPASFVAGIADAQKRSDAQALIDLLGQITGEPPVMWGPSIVGFGRTHYVYESGREGDTFRVGFSPRKQNLALYIGAMDEQAALLDQLGPHSRGKGCLYIKRLRDVDHGVLKRLVEASVIRPRR